MSRFGGFLGGSGLPEPSNFNSSAPGVYSLDAAGALRRLGYWPIIATADPYYAITKFILSSSVEDAAPTTITVSGAPGGYASGTYTRANTLLNGKPYWVKPAEYPWVIGWDGTRWRISFWYSNQAWAQTWQQNMAATDLPPTTGWEDTSGWGYVGAVFLEDSAIKDISAVAESITNVSYTRKKIDGPTGLPIYAAYNSRSSAYIRPNDKSAISLGASDYTLECWIWPIGQGYNDQPLFDTRTTNGAGGTVFGFRVSDGAIRADDSYSFGSGSVQMRQWNHVAFARENGLLSVYVNGNRQGNPVISTVNHSSSTLVVGGYSSSLGSNPFIGYIADARVTIGASRYAGASFAPPVIPVPLVQENIAPLAPRMSDPLYGDTEVKVNWSNAFNGGTAITDFDIEYATASNMSGGTIVNVPVSGPVPTSYTVTELTNGTPYYFRVRANNAVGAGAYSSIVGPVTPSASLPMRLIGGAFERTSYADPNEYDVSLLLHFDGLDGDTEFTDTSTAPKKISKTGNVVISTAESKYGSSSVYFDGGANALTVPMSSDFNFSRNNFTIEFWLYPTAYNSNSSRLIQTRDGDTYAGLNLGLGDAGQLSLYSSSNGSSWNLLSNANAYTVALNEWTHIALVRNGDTFSIFVNGTSVYTATSSGTLYYNAGDKLIIGGQTTGTNRSLSGYMDEIRITNHVARYTADFPVATTSFPDPTRRPMYLGASFKQDEYWYSTSQADKIFDNNLNDSNENQWKAYNLNRAFGVNFGMTQEVLRYRMWRNTGNQNTPTGWVLQGSNTQSDWDSLPNYTGTQNFGNWQTIDTRTNVNLPLVYGSSPAANAYGEFVVANPGSYRYYRLFVTGARADGPGTEAARSWIAEMQFLAVVGAPNTPTNFSAYPADGSANLSWSSVGPSITGFVVEWSDDGGETVIGNTTVTGVACTITGLVNGDSYVFRVKTLNTVGASSFTAWSSAVVPAAGYTPIQDNIFRFTLGESATSATMSVDTTTRYYRLVSSTGQTSVVHNGGSWGYWPYQYIYGNISGMPTGQEKTVEIISCDSNGNPSGELTYVNLSLNNTPITRVDASGCTSLRGFNLSSTTAGQFGWTPGGKNLPSAITEIRCIGVRGQYGFWYQWNINYPAYVGQGINLAGQQLSAAALNQIYTDLDTSRSSGAAIMVKNNPGISADDPTIATAKGYAVYGS